MTVAGTPEARKQAEYTRDLWIKYGMDKVKIHKYNILLSYPVKPANITMYNEDGKRMFRYTINKEKLYTKEKNDPRRIFPFNAYSPSADVEVCNCQLDKSDVFAFRK